MFLFAKKLVGRLEGGANEQAYSAEDNAYFKNTLEINNKGHGLRVIHVEPHTHAHEIGLESWFDYIVGVNGHDLPMLNPAPSYYAVNDDGTIKSGGTDAENEASAVDYAVLEEELKRSLLTEQPVLLKVWSAKGGVLREVPLQLACQQRQAECESLYFYDYLVNTGLTVASRHLRTAAHVWHILRSHPQLPASTLQLVPSSDYIIGCDSAYADDTDFTGMLAAGGEARLSHSVLDYYNHHSAKQKCDQVPITFFVYNHDYDILRPVTVSLSRSWSNGQNKGLLGCDVGYGLLHRIPEVAGKFGGEQTETSGGPMAILEAEGVSAPAQLGDYGALVPSTSDGKGTAGLGHALPQPAQNSLTPGAMRVSAIEQPGRLQGSDHPGGQTFEVSPLRTSANRKQKAHVRTDVAGGIADIMNEELARSKAQDVKGPPEDSHVIPPPPPPPPRGA